MLSFNFVQVIIHVHVLVCVNCVRIRSCIWIMSDGLGTNSLELFWLKAQQVSVPDVTDK